MTVKLEVHNGLTRTEYALRMARQAEQNGNNDEVRTWLAEVIKDAADALKWTVS